MLHCKRRVQGGRNVLRQSHLDSPLFPDFAFWPAAGYLTSKDLGKLARVSTSFWASVSHDFFLPGLLKERQHALGVSTTLKSLAHLHLAEAIALRRRLRLVFDVCCCDVRE